MITYGERDLICCCVGLTKPKFRQIKIILIPHINIFLFTIYFSSAIFIFLLGYNKINRNEKFSTFGSVESRSKDDQYFSFLDVLVLKLRIIIIIILLTNQTT